jgi:Zn-finger nucleic acid-binding protein
MRSCPKCETELKPKAIGPVEVDECEMCKGVWFDKDELRQAKDVTDSDLNWMDFEIWKHEDRFKSKGTKINCPVCKTETVAIDYGSTAIEVDYCPSCQGIWLDEDEFKKIIESLESDLVSKSFSEYIKDSIEEAKEIITGPESFISEWKDFMTILRMMQYRMFLENPKLLETIASVQKANPLQ